MNYLILFTAVLFSLFSCDTRPITKGLKAEMELAFSSSQAMEKEGLVKTYIRTKSQNKEIVFIAGFDEGNETFYSKATAYFKNTNSEVVEGLTSLAEIINWLNSSSQTYHTIHIVSHSNAWRGMSLKTYPEGERITLFQLKDEQTKSQIPSLCGGVSNNTQIIFHSCGLGSNTALVDALKNKLSDTYTLTIQASPYFAVFDGKYADYYYAKPYYVFYPTGHSKGPLALAQQAKASYPEVSIPWRKALTFRKETGVGDPYSYRFNIPVHWEIDFEDAGNIPQIDSTASLLDFIITQDDIALALYQMGIPLEYFRWDFKQSENKLIIKGKTTVLTVLQPLMETDDTGAYVMPVFQNT